MASNLVYSLKEFIIPEHFDLMCEVAKESTTSEERTLKIGFLIGKLCDIMIGKYRREENYEMRDKVLTVRDMYQTEWKVNVSIQLLKQKRRKKLNKKVSV